MKKIMLALCAIIMGISFSSAQACLFGSSLQDMARMSDLQIGPKITISKKTVLSKIQKKQILNALQKEESEILTLENAFDYTDDRVFYVKTVFDTLSNEMYTMYTYHAGDTLCGFIFRENTVKQVARIGDGSIFDCKVSFFPTFV